MNHGQFPYWNPLKSLHDFAVFLAFSLMPEQLSIFVLHLIKHSDLGNVLALMVMNESPNPLLDILLSRMVLYAFEWVLVFVTSGPHSQS